MRALVGFAGFGGVDIALREMGYDVTGIEIDRAIAAVNRLNGGHCLTADIRDIDPASYTGWELYHFSPPCPSYSLARNRKSRQNIYQRISDLSRFQRLLNSESEIDLQLSRKIAQFIRVGRPGIITLENVWAYRKSLSFANIWYALVEAGYSVGCWHLNTANYGVAQSRKRMIVIARRDGRQPAKPWPTHSKTGDMFTKPWRGWYEAVEDLITDLPETHPAPWQLDRMPDELKTCLVMTANTNRNGVDNTPGRGWLGVDRPANTVCTSAGGAMPRAFIINSQNTTRSLTVRQGDEPSVTVNANAFEKNSPPKAFIMDCQNNGIPHSSRWVSMTPRALARFQDFPDWFKLPDNRELACRGIGNALPPGMYQAVVRSLTLQRDTLNIKYNALML